MFVVLELVSDKLFGMADADCRLLGCNATAERERGRLDGRHLHNSWDLTLLATV
jgi:hypothetical protein